MSYYKITYESNTIEGLKAIQGGFLGHKASATDSSTGETTVPPPRQHDGENLDAFSGVVQAPPTADEAGASLDKNAFHSPPPTVADSAVTDIGSEGEIPPPPKDKLQDREGTEGRPNVPPQQPASKNPKAAKKSSK